MATLPTPHTTTDVLLVALHEEIVGLRQDLAKSRGGERKATGPGEPALLEEPKPSTARRSSKTAR